MESGSGVPKSSLEEVVSFWGEVDQNKKFSKDEQFDALIRSKYSELHEQLMSGEYDSLLKETPMPATLGAVIVLDQFSRNMFRGSPKAFASDKKALSLCKSAIERGCDRIAGDDKMWFYVLFMHSEDIADQELCVQYMQDMPSGSAFAIEHRDIIKSFGRFPHRNSVLGRESSEKEMEFMKTHKGF